jgi:hypothetical protein
LAFALLLAGGSVGASILVLSKPLARAGVVGKLPWLLVLGSLVLLAAPYIVTASERVLARLGLEVQPTEEAQLQELLVFCLLIPWIILVIVAEPGKPERLSWLWPTKVIFLSASVTYFLRRFAAPKWAVAAAQCAVALVLVANPFLVGRVNSWARNGWAGQDAEEIQALDTIARKVKAEGKNQAAIGYQVFIYPFMANYNITNPIYKAGAEFDLLFKYRHAVANTNQCPEGLSPADEYRIVQTRPKSGEEQPEHYFHVPPDPRFRLIQSFDLYQVFKRD